jgi:tryptophan-rich sensory protein
MPERLRPWLVLALFVALCLAVGGVGSIITASSRESWYATLRRPDWAPPDRVFGPVWTTLYIAMAVAAWLVWRRLRLPGAAVPLALFGAQLALNLAWSAIFFGLRSPGGAFLEIIALWAAVLATLVAFWRVSRPAGWLFVPYLLWVTYAAALNFAIWRLNPTA